MGFLLLIPFLLLRFGLMALLGRDALARASHFAPMEKGERGAYLVYQISTAAIFLYLCFLQIHITPSPLFYAGAAMYLAGLGLLAASIAAFAAPEGTGINRRGVYRLSRNPMYAAYFVIFLGCALLTRSLLLLGFVLSFQISAHWIIRAEERWCEAQFGEAYRQYRSQVRRYL